MTREELILTRMIELLVAAGHVSQEKMDETRQLALSFPMEMRQCDDCGRDWTDAKVAVCPFCGSSHTFVAVFEDEALRAPGGAAEGA